MNIDRQSHDRCKHPTLGEGEVVYDNGPARFVADSGEIVPLKSVRLGGMTSTPRRHWLVAIAATGERIELDTTGLPRSDAHTRAVSLMLGPGWLVQLAVDHDKRLEYRFEPDGGQPITTPADAAAELAGLRALLADVRHLGHVGCASCSAMATQVVQSEPHASDLWKGAQQITFRRYCDAHAPPEATPLPWAGVVGKAGK